MGFDFTATARCHTCGQYLSSSDEDCDHEGRTVEQHMFRRITDGEPATIAIRSSREYMWHALEREVGDDWLAYEYIGRREMVQSVVGGAMWDSIDDLPQQAMALNAPDDVGSGA